MTPAESLRKCLRTADDPRLAAIAETLDPGAAIYLATIASRVRTLERASAELVRQLDRSGLANSNNTPLGVALTTVVRALDDVDSARRGFAEELI